MEEENPELSLKRTKWDGEQRRFTNKE